MKLRPEYPSVSALMSKKIVTIHMEDSIRMAYQIMQENKFRHLPVTDAAGNIIGILSDRDIQRAMKVSRQGIDTEIEFSAEDTCQDYMQWPIQTCSDQTSIAQAVDKMLNEKISAFLIVDSVSGRARGMLTTDDLLKYLKQLLSEDPALGKKSLGSFESHLFLED